MQQNTQAFAYHRGECVDLHIAVLRESAENSYGQLFADAVKLRHKLDDPSLPDSEYDAYVIGLICSTIVTIRPMPSPLRSCLGALLAVELDARAQLINVSPRNEPKKEIRSDVAWVDLLITTLERGLYPLNSYLPNLTDIRSGLEGLHLTLRKDITAEADCHGVISVEGVQRIRNKLVVAMAESEVRSRAALAGSSSSEPTDVEWRRLARDRQLKLLEIIEHTASIGSSLVCIPSRLREGRIGGGERYADAAEYVAMG